MNKNYSHEGLEGEYLEGTVQHAVQFISIKGWGNCRNGRPSCILCNLHNPQIDKTIPSMVQRICS